jgi:hypothetical protein
VNILGRERSVDVLSECECEFDVYPVCFAGIHDVYV